MTTTAGGAVRDLLATLRPRDDLEIEHLGLARAWAAGTDDLFRRARPATPAPHLVSYLLPWDEAAQRLLLVDHRLSGLRLPAGGHVEPGEHPRETARREALEELGVEVDLLDGGTPRMLTWTPTVGPASHIDVSLWYLLRGDVDRPLDWCRREFSGVRWWSREEIAAADPATFDPHLVRLLARLAPRAADDRPTTSP